MPPTSLVNLSSLIDDAKCYALVRQRRWPDGVRCPARDSRAAIRDGCDGTQPNRQIAQELGLAGPDVQLMTEQLRHGLAAKLPAVRLEGEVEIDEVYVVAGHKGQPAAVAKRGVRDGAAGWRERRAVARRPRTSRRSSA